MKTTKSLDEKAHKDKAATELEYFVEARLERHNLSEKKQRAYTKKMLQAAINSLDLVGKGQSLDVEIADWLSDILSPILANRKSPELEGVRGRGAAEDTESIREAKSTAAIYKKAVEAKDIEDHRYIKTLCEYYGCKPQTIRDWCKDAPDDAWSEFRKDLLPIDRIKQLERKLRHDGKLIRECSQTQGAVTARKRPKIK